MWNGFCQGLQNIAWLSSLPTSQEYNLISDANKRAHKSRLGINAGIPWLMLICIDDF